MSFLMKHFLMKFLDSHSLDPNSVSKLSKFNSESLEDLEFNEEL